jgi:valyl-tRNA synthetase
MRAKQAGVVTALLWLTGCATTAPPPDIQEQVPEQVEAQILEQAQEHVQAMEKARAQEQGLTASLMLSALERVATVEAGNAKQMAKQLQAGANDLTAEDRFELILLLSQKGADDKSLRQALLLLNELEAEANAPSVKEVLRLQRHNLHLQKLYRKERRKSAELQKKIEYLKGLEQQLDESNKRAKEPLEGKKESTQ